MVLTNELESCRFVLNWKNSCSQYNRLLIIDYEVEHKLCLRLLPELIKDHCVSGSWPSDWCYGVSVVAGSPHISFFTNVSLPFRSVWNVKKPAYRYICLPVMVSEVRCAINLPIILVHCSSVFRGGIRLELQWSLFEIPYGSFS